MTLVIKDLIYFKSSFKIISGCKSNINTITITILFIFSLFTIVYVTCFSFSFSHFLLRVTSFKSLFVRKEEIMEISSALAQTIVADMKKIINQELNFIGTDGLVIASTDPTRINTYHEGAKRVISTKEDLIIEA